MNCLLTSIIESIYIIYILCFFKTKINFAHPITYFNNSFFYHPIGKINNERNLICPFGHLMAYIVVIFILTRCFFTLTMKQNYFKKYHYNILIIGILLSIMNFNAFIYLLPVFLFEYYYLVL